jgi:hypothetical protein
MSTTAAVMGTGSWGTAFAAALADAGTAVTMWGRRADSVAQINAGSNEDYLPGIPLPRRDPSHHRSAGGADRGRHRRPRGAVANAARQPRRLVAAVACRGRLAHEGRRAGHDQADERGHHGRRGCPPTAWSSCPDPTWPRRSPASSRPPVSSPAPTPGPRTGSRPPATRHTSGPIPTRTSSGPSLVGRSRTSSPSRWAWPKAWAWATTPRPRSSPGGWPRRPGSVCASGPSRQRSWAWRASATSSRRACRRSRATAPSARTSARG